MPCVMACHAVKADADGRNMDNRGGIFVKCIHRVCKHILLVFCCIRFRAPVVGIGALNAECFAEFDIVFRAAASGTKEDNIRHTGFFNGFA